MAILHLVLFGFKQDVATATRRQLLQEFLSLPQKCRDASQNLYIKSIRAGSSCSPAAAAEASYTHCFIFEFDSIDQREYYKSMDPVHAGFASRITPLLDQFKIEAFDEIELSNRFSPINFLGACAKNGFLRTHLYRV